MHPLNYTPKAIDCLKNLLAGQEPMDRAGAAFIIEKLRNSQVFVLPDYGQLMDRSSPRSRVAEAVFRPPFPVTSVEFPASPAGGHMQGEYTVEPSTRRIALAWEWPGEYPFTSLIGFDPGPGVAVASVCWLDRYQSWAVMPMAAHLPMNGAWQTPQAISASYASAFYASAIEHGRIPRRNIAGDQLRATPLPILPNAVSTAMSRLGPERAMDAMHADTLDEFNAYADMCSALACRNVSTEVRPASKLLNKERVRKGKSPLLDMHVLKLGESEMGAARGAASDRTGARQHLRRGHIRRLGPDRITWVNQTMVRGHSFVEKVYAL